MLSYESFETVIRTLDVESVTKASKRSWRFSKETDIILYNWASYCTIGIIFECYNRVLQLFIVKSYNAAKRKPLALWNQPTKKSFIFEKIRLTTDDP